MACGAVLRPAEAEPVRLGEIAVQAAPFDDSLPARTEVEREEMIEAHKSELSEQLELTPGINVRNGGRGEVRVDMRGFDQRAVLLTLDGIPLYDPYNGVINLDLFPLEMLESIEISRGASSALYGPNGMAGAIQMKSLLPRSEPKAAASTIWRNSDFWDARASGAATFGPATGAIAGRYLTTPGFPLSDDFAERPPNRRRLDDGGLRLNSDRDEKSVFARLGWQDEDVGRIQGGVLASTASFGIPPSSTQFLPMFLRVDEENLLNGNIGIDRRLTPSLGIGAAVFYTGYKLVQTTYETVDFDAKLLTSTVDSSDIGGIGRLTWDIAPVDSLAVAVQVRQDQADISDDFNGALGHPSFTIASAAFENLWNPIEPLTIVLGFSLDMQTGGGRGTVVEPDPQAVFAYDLERWGSVRAAISRKVRFPTLRELFDPLQGDASLQAESALTDEIGYTLSGEPGFVQINLFRSTVDNLIVNQGSGELGVFGNLQTAVQQGVELAGRVLPAAWLQIDANYTFLNAEAKQDKIGWSEIQHKPAHRFNGVLQARGPWSTVLRLEGLYTSDQVDQFGSPVRADGFTQFNAQVTYGVVSWLSLFGGVDNLLDSDNEQRLGTPEPGRWAFAGVRATY